MKGKNSMHKNGLKDYLKERGISPSYQRLKILDYLLKDKAHPSAEMIYKDVFRDIPVLSRTTVYNTLNAFVEKGIVSVLTIDGNELRYDADTGRHTHFKCVKCGCVVDFNPKCPMFKEGKVDGHKVLECCIYVRGICKCCLKKGRN